MLHLRVQLLLGFWHRCPHFIRSFSIGFWHLLQVCCPRWRYPFAHHSVHCRNGFMQRCPHWLHPAAVSDFPPASATGVGDSAHGDLIGGEWAPLPGSASAAPGDCGLRGAVWGMHGLHECAPLWRYPRSHHWVHHCSIIRQRFPHWVHPRASFHCRSIPATVRSLSAIFRSHCLRYWGGLA